jgi:Fe-Mn family superoxide dismutase
MKLVGSATVAALLCMLALTSVAAQGLAENAVAEKPKVMMTGTPAPYMCPFNIPMLEYASHELQPPIDMATVVLHLTKHHQAYVTNLCNLLAMPANMGLRGKTLRQLNGLVGANNAMAPAGSTVERTLRNQAGGHYNHCLYWRQFIGNIGEKFTVPRTSLMANAPMLYKAIMATYMNETNFRAQMLAAGSGVFGSGWAWLVVDKSMMLKIVTTANQDAVFNPLITAMPGIPILGIDVWEHAYYLKYQNVRASYITAIFDIINWPRLEMWYKDALKGKYPNLDTLGTGCGM